MGKRENKVLDILSKHGKIEVAVLAEEVGVSQVTIRKDLDDLEEKGIVRREHGYAIIGGLEDVNNRLAFNYEEKKKIAKLAATLVAPGETVMIENGSCCTLLAEEIARTNQGATIITNSAFIASYIRRIDGVKIVLLGGDFQNDAQVMVGPILKTCVSQFFVDKLFVGIDGFSKERGFATNNHLRAQAVRDMAEHASKVIIVTESQKFKAQSVVPLYLETSIKYVVTDEKISSETEKGMLKNGIDVIKNMK